MTRLFIFVTSIVAYSSIGLVAFSQLAPTTAATTGSNVTVVYKTDTYPVKGALFLGRCVAGRCKDGISI